MNDRISQIKENIRLINEKQKSLTQMPHQAQKQHAKSTCKTLDKVFYGKKGVKIESLSIKDEKIAKPKSFDIVPSTFANQRLDKKKIIIPQSTHSQENYLDRFQRENAQLQTQNRELYSELASQKQINEKLKLKIQSLEFENTKKAIGLANRNIRKEREFQSKEFIERKRLKALKKHRLDYLKADI